MREHQHGLGSTLESAPHHLYSDRAHRLRCVIADGSVAFSAGLAMLLARDHGVDIVGQATSREHFVALVKATHIDVAIIGFEPFRRALEARFDIPDTPALLLRSGHATSDIIEALRADVPGLLSKDASIDDMARALPALVAGRRVYPDGWERALVAWVDQARYRDRKGTIEPLTTREQEIVQLVVDGCSNRQVALVLGIAQQTVKNHLHSVLRKVGGASRNDLVIWALEKGFVRQVDPDSRRH